MRIAITGPPGCGKSSVIDFIRDNQYHTFQPKPYEEDSAFVLVPEVARNTFAFLEQYEPEKMKDFVFRQQLLETLQLMNWIDNPHAIFDRGLPDEYAYRAYFGNSSTEAMQLLWSKCRQHKYDKVFIFPFWEDIYKQDDVRKETPAEAKRLETFLMQSYIACGYQPIEVPKDSVENRVDFIYNNL
jgi:predicted ATPase